MKNNEEKTEVPSRTQGSGRNSREKTLRKLKIIRLFSVTLTNRIRTKYISKNLSNITYHQKRSVTKFVSEKYATNKMYL